MLDTGLFIDFCIIQHPRLPSGGQAETSIQHFVAKVINMF